ncbi:37S ribosomal protein S16, mitochondrial [Rhinocladiella similis]
MVLRIRLARFGTKRAPVYNIVLAQAKSARGKKPIEVLGTYDPIPRLPLATPDTPEYLSDGTKFVPRRYKDIKLDTSRTKYWLGVGAQPTEPVVKLLSMIGLIEPKPSPSQSRTTQQQQQQPQTPSTPSTESIPTQQQKAATATA